MRALEHVDHLELGLVQVLLRHHLGIALADEADDMGERHAVGGVLDAEVAVMRVGAQPVGLEVAPGRDGLPRTCADGVAFAPVAAPRAWPRARRAALRARRGFLCPRNGFRFALAMIAPPCVVHCAIMLPWAGSGGKRSARKVALFRHAVIRAITVRARCDYTR